MKQKNNLDFLRLLFATLVLVTHSYALTGLGDQDFLYWITDGQLHFSYLSVNAFFVISGFLIFQSYERTDSFKDFFWKRIIRVFPGLIVVLLITTLVLGPVLTEYSLKEYFGLDTAKYFFNTLIMVKPPDKLPGVFVDNPFPFAVNGSLWTIRYELLCYFMIGLFYLVRQKQHLIKWILIIAFVGFYLMHLAAHYHFITITNIKIQSLNRLALYFIAGSLLAIYRFDKRCNPRVFLFGSLAIIILTTYFNVSSITEYLVFPFLILSLAFVPLSLISNIGKWGDFSYGIYIYGFPIQQTLIYYFGLNYLELTVACIPLTFVMGIASWHLIEKPALKYKNHRLAFKGNMAVKHLKGSMLPVE